MVVAPKASLYIYIFILSLSIYIWKFVLAQQVIEDHQLVEVAERALVVFWLQWHHGTTVERRGHVCTFFVKY